MQNGNRWVYCGKIQIEKRGYEVAVGKFIICLSVKHFFLPLGKKTFRESETASRTKQLTGSRPQNKGRRGCAETRRPRYFSFICNAGVRTRLGHTSLRAYRDSIVSKAKATGRTEVCGFPRLHGKLFQSGGEVVASKIMLVRRFSRMGRSDTTITPWGAFTNYGATPG
jgi:hypothetical protein